MTGTNDTKPKAEPDMPEILDHDGFNPTPENYATTVAKGNPFRTIDTSIRDDDQHPSEAPPMSLDVKDIEAAVDARILQETRAKLQEKIKGAKPVVVNVTPAADGIKMMAAALQERPQRMPEGNDVEINSDEDGVGADQDQEPPADTPDTPDTPAEGTPPADRRLGHLPNASNGRRKQ